MPPPGSVTVYVTSWCPFCRRLRSELNRAGVRYDEIDIDRDPQAAGYVENVNRGDRTVPTVLFPDGSTLTNPAAADVARVLDDC